MYSVILVKERELRVEKLKNVQNVEEKELSLYTRIWVFLKCNKKYIALNVMERGE
jgi:hypothetical protein